MTNETLTSRLRANEHHHDTQHLADLLTSATPLSPQVISAACNMADDPAVTFPTTFGDDLWVSVKKG